MESRRSYAEIEPFSKWQRDQPIDILDIDLSGFKKEELRVQLSNDGMLVINADHPLDQTKDVHKEIKVSDCIWSEIRAKLTDGVFYIIMPKTRTENNQPVQQNEEHVEEKPNVEEKVSSGGGDDVSRKMEPDCIWRKGQPIDIFEIHLADFKKEKLRVQVSNAGMLVITGERPVGQTKGVKFRKEVKVSDDYIWGEIRAKLTDGVFYIIIPKKQVDEKPKVEEKVSSGGDDVSRKMCRWKRPVFPRTQMGGKTALKLGALATVAVVVGVGAYLAYKYHKSLHVENCLIIWINSVEKIML